MSAIGSILSNAGAIAALNGIAQSQGAMGLLETQLSTGLSINSPFDNPAGYIEAQGLTSQVNGLSQSARNLNEGMSLLQTAQGGISQQESILQKLNSIAVAAANGTLTPQQRIADQGVVSNLLGQMNDIANQTQFNGINLLNGSLTGIQFQAGASQGQTLNLSIPGTRASSLAVAKGTAHAGSYVSQVASENMNSSGYSDIINPEGSPGGNVLISGPTIKSIYPSGSLIIRGSKGSAKISGSSLFNRSSNTTSSYTKNEIKSINSVSSKTGVTAYQGSHNLIFNTKNAPSGSLYFKVIGTTPSTSIIKLNGSNGSFVRQFNISNHNPNITASLNSSGNVNIKSSSGVAASLSLKPFAGGTSSGGTTPVGSSGGTSSGGTKPVGSSGGTSSGGTTPVGSSGGTSSGGTTPVGSSGGTSSGGTTPVGSSGGTSSGGTTPVGSSGGTSSGGTKPVGPAPVGSSSGGTPGGGGNHGKHIGHNHGNHFGRLLISRSITSRPITTSLFSTTTSPKSSYITFPGAIPTSSGRTEEISFSSKSNSVIITPTIELKSGGSFNLSGNLIRNLGLSSKSISTGGGSSVPKSSGASSPPPNLSAINVLSQTAAQNAITTIQSALSQLGSIQGYLGASQQRFQAQIGVLQTTGINTQNGLATVQDANIPQVSSQLTQEQIQSQAGVAALKSSNSLQQSFLSLLP